MNIKAYKIIQIIIDLYLMIWKYNVSGNTRTRNKNLVDLERDIGLIP